MAEHPIRSLKASNFGPFSELDVAFSPKINVILGDNSTGKTQLLKLLYACTHVLEDEKVETRTATELAIAKKLIGVFKPDSLGRLANRLQGTTASKVDIKYDGIGERLRFGFSTRSRTDVKVDSYPMKWLPDKAVFLPSRELLSIYPGLVALYDQREVAFDETWRDTAQLLSLSTLRGAREKRARQLLEPLLELLDGGSVIEEGGRFYLRQSGVGKIEASLVAEGHRKLAMIVRLVTSGVLLEEGYLFWDEPEANLNPASQRAAAVAIRELARNGAQVFIATHSLYLVRELEMQAEESVDVRYIALHRGTPDAAQGGEVQVPGVFGESVTSLNDVEVFSALDAESEQSRKYLEY